MSTTPIRRPLPGERVIGLSPENAGEAAQAWLRRPHIFAGRALTANALVQSQAWQAGHLAKRGQDWVAGVVDGLEVQVQTGEGAGFAAVKLRVSQGRGLAVSGEDTVLQRPLECLLADVPVIAPPGFFVDGSGVEPGVEGAPPNLRPRSVGATLGELGASSLATLLPIGVLLLQPVLVDTADFDPLDPCDRSACDEGTVDDAAAFEDWRTADAVRLLWYVWPGEWRGVPAMPAPQLRNALAWTVFQAAEAAPVGDALPWEDWGVPIAMVALDAAQQVLWVDRASVVRAGGRARDARLHLAGTTVAADSRLPSLWQARIEQFAEQIAAAGEPAPAADVLADAFARFLPPVGLIPKNGYDPVARSSGFFPTGFDVDAVPVPVEQLDLAVRASAPLAPLNLSSPESVRILVPVPLSDWEPRLLLKEIVDPEFQRTLDAYLLKRARTLGLRQGLRNQAAMLSHALSGQMQTVPLFKDDPLALEAESLSPWGAPPAGGGHRSAVQFGQHEHLFDGAAPFLVNATEALFAWVCLDPDNPPRSLMLRWHMSDGWEHAAFWGEDLIRHGGAAGTPGHLRAGDLPTPGQWAQLSIRADRIGLAGQQVDGMGFVLFDGRAAYGLTGTQGTGVWQKWFCNFLPQGARPQGNEAWDLLTANDLWAPFEPRDGVVPSLPELVSIPIQDADGSEADSALQLAVPTAGFNLYYPSATGWRGHILTNAAAGSSIVSKPLNQADRIRSWIYLDELSPPRAICAFVKCRGYNAVGAGGNVINTKIVFWGENHLSELPLSDQRDRQFFTHQIERGGALPRSGAWTQIETVIPEVVDPNASTVGVFSIVFLAYGGNVAFSELLHVPADTSVPPDRIWPQQVIGLKTVPAYTPYLNATLVPQNNLGVLTPTPSSRIGTVRVYTELAGDPLMARLSLHEQSQLLLRGLDGFADYLRTRIDRADDITDFGFAHMQVDMYRIRQMTMNTADVSRLAISPTLAAIAKSDSALAVQSQIKDYIASVKSVPARALSAASAAATDANNAAINRAAVGTVAINRTAVSTFAISQAAVRTLAISRPGVATDRIDIGTIAINRPGIGTAALNIGSSTVALDRTQVLARANTAAYTLQTLPQLIAPPRAPIGTVYSNPVVGLSEVRTTAIAERLRNPPSTEARDYALANRQRTVASLVDLLEQFVAEDSGEIPALFVDFSVVGLTNDPFLKGATNNARNLIEFRASVNPGLLAELGKPPTLSNNPLNTTTPLVDEATLFNQSISLSDITIALLRQLEARLTLYRDALTRCESALDDLNAESATSTSRLGTVEDELAEARYDVSVARSLLAEETERILGINTRRAKVLADEVKFLAYIRPREVDNLLATPTHSVDPGLVEAPVPACLRDHPDPPAELLDMLRVVREAPATWFVALPPIIRTLDRIDQLVRLVQSAQLRAYGGSATPQLAARFDAIGAIGASIARVASRQVEAVAPRLLAVRSLDVASFASASWQAIRVQAEPAVSFADLAEGGHGRADVAQAAASELENIRAVVACLHAEFSGVLPLLRLQWADTMSEFDAAPNLRNLASLPRWAEIALDDRRRMQAYVDWLFGQIEPGQTQAVALVNDVVRMCLLLASHAPVDRIIAGRMARPITGVSPGIRIPLTALDPGSLRIGMQALMYRNDTLMARAEVEDVGPLEISARVIHTVSERVDLGDDVRIHFDNTAMVSLAATSAKRTLFGR